MVETPNSNLTVPRIVSGIVVLQGLNVVRCTFRVTIVIKKNYRHEIPFLENDTKDF